MQLDKLIYVKETKRSYDEAIVSVLKATEKKGWAVFQIYEIHKRLAAKGFSHEPIAIIEICSARHASSLLQENKLISLCMPCRVNVISEKGKIMVSALSPGLAGLLFEKLTKEKTEEAEKEIREIIDDATGAD